MSESEVKISLNKHLERPREAALPDQRVAIDISLEDDPEPGDNNNDDGDEEDEDEDEDDWWESDAASTTGSYYSENDSSIVEWDSAIKWTGEVFYIESLPTASSNEGERVISPESKSPSPELTRRRSTRAGKLMRLIRRRESRRCSMRNKKAEDKRGLTSPMGAKIPHRSVNSQGVTKEVTFRDSEAGEIREVVVRVDPGRRHKLGRRATLCEAYLGICPGAFSDNLRVMVAGLVPGGEAMKNKNIKIGDWLRNVGGREANVKNLDGLLSAILEPCDVKLELQRVAGSEIGKTPIESSSEKQSPMVRRLVSEEDSRPLMESLMKHSVGIIFVKTTGLSETGPELQDVLYTFPRSLDSSAQSVLCKARGAFVTLDHMLPGVSGPRPISTTTSLDNEFIHISYVPRGEELLLLAFPNKYCCLQEALEITDDLVRALEFSYQTLSKCFLTKENHPTLDHFFSLIFWRLINDSSNTVPSSTTINANESNTQKGSDFEDTLPAARFVQLPRDAQIQIDAALNEMEAMDYRDWNEDPMDCQRLYTILGSCLYHRDFLLGSHLPRQDLIEIHSFLRQKGLLNLVRDEPVKSLIIWKEVYPLSCNRGILDTVDETQPFVPNGKWFLLVVGFANQLLAVLLESGGCTAELEDNASPDIFYVEEAQETLKHVQKIGIPTLAEKWIAANVRPETELSQYQSPNKSIPSIAENFLGLVKSSDSRSNLNKINSQTIKKSPEVSSILKRRSFEQSNASTGSVYSLQTSEDSTSQGTGAVSEASDDAAPILGRRATRERTLHNNSLRQSDGSDSDMDYDRNESQMSTMDISDIRQNLLNQAEYVVPKKVSAGGGEALLHYVHLDTLEGVLLSSNSITGNFKDSNIMQLFNASARVIHKLLQKTARFEKMLNQDTDKSVINKNLIAIKEHGVLFECEGETYWVVGRSFASPQPRELYVCYHDSTPQSLVEMAFRLNAT